MGERAEHSGAATFIQRFGSAFNLNVHFHTLALDGVYPDALDRGQAPRFLPLSPPEPDEVSRVLAGAASLQARIATTSYSNTPASGSGRRRDRDVRF